MRVPEVVGEVGVAHAVLVGEINESPLGVSTNDFECWGTGLRVNRGSDLEGPVDSRSHIRERETVREDDVVVFIVRETLPR